MAVVLEDEDAVTVRSCSAAPVDRFRGNRCEDRRGVELGGVELGGVDTCRDTVGFSITGERSAARGTADGAVVDGGTDKRGVVGFAVAELRDVPPEPPEHPASRRPAAARTAGSQRLRMPPACQTTPMRIRG